jgi:phosphonate metabolism protein PhnN/1,5-bisphosphokinase (PRPP-forming)
LTSPDSPQPKEPRRIVKRPRTGETEAHDMMSADEFLAAEKRGDFVLSWEAHDLHYGISASIRGNLSAGRTVAVNVSRAIIAEAGMRFPNLAVLHVTAPVTIIAERLAQRGRETAEEIARRIAREPPHFETRFEAVTIVNDTTLEPAAASFITALLRFAEAPHAASV